MTDTEVKAALYARVSTTDQSPDLQLDALRKLESQRGWRVVGEFVDVGWSGAKERRPELDRLMAEAHRGSLDLIACWPLDRFARSIRHLLRALDDFKARAIDFVSVQDGIDISTSAGRFVFTLVAEVGELERELIRERTKAGSLAARRRGARIGRPPRQINVQCALQLREQGLSWRQVARELDDVGVATVLRAIKASTEGGVSKPSSKSPVQVGEITGAKIAV